MITKLNITHTIKKFRDEYIDGIEDDGTIIKLWRFYDGDVLCWLYNYGNYGGQWTKINTFDRLENLYFKTFNQRKDKLNRILKHDKNN